jgi:hypothetical protein
MVQVTFCVVLKTELLPVTISNDARIHQTFQCLKSESHVARRILGRTLFDQYDYYKLKNPVPLPDDRPIADIVQDDKLARTVSTAFLEGTGADANE